MFTVTCLKRTTLSYLCRMYNSPHRTQDPNEALFFYIPFYGSSQVHAWKDKNFTDKYGKLDDLIKMVRSCSTSWCKWGGSLRKGWSFELELRTTTSISKQSCSEKYFYCNDNAKSVSIRYGFITTTIIFSACFGPAQKLFQTHMLTSTCFSRTAGQTKLRRDHESWVPKAWVNTIAVIWWRNSLRTITKNHGAKFKC